MDLDHQTYIATTSGLDEALQGFSTDPFGRNVPGALGLRVPPVLPTEAPDNTGQPRYLFLLDTRTISTNQKTTIRGVRFGLTIGIKQAVTGGTLVREFAVKSPWWHFPDGNVSWHLVREPNDDISPQRPLTDAPSWRFQQSDQPAMLYQAATFSMGNFNPQTGAPLFYPVGLTTYKPPVISASQWNPIANLGNVKGLVYPWNPESDNKLNVVVTGNTRISLYADVLQSNPATRPRTTLTANNVISSGIAPEDAFVSNFTSGEGNIVGPIYWRVFGAVLFDDAFGED
jgi:hypothetical protein